MKTIKSRKQIWVSVILGGLLVVILLFSNPQNLPVWFLIVPPFIVFLALLSAFHLLVSMYQDYKGVQNRTNRLLYSSILALIPAGILVLGSIGQLTVKDFAFSVVFLILIIFYLSRVGVIGRR